MASSNATNDSSPTSDGVDLDFSFAATAEDLVVLRALRGERPERILVRMNDLSAATLEMGFVQRRSTSAGREPFSL